MDWNRSLVGWWRFEDNFDEIIERVEERVRKDKYLGTEELNVILKEEIAALLERTIPLALNGKYEEYKTYIPEPDHEHNEPEEES